MAAPRVVTLSAVVPCFNEEATLERSVRELLRIEDETLRLEILIVDDCSTDASLEVARRLAAEHPRIAVLAHETNRGKGAAVRTGFSRATGDFVAVQDADLEYDPRDLKRLLVPLINDDADVVLGSRFATSGPHRVLYYWHSVGNRFLTALSNMLTDLNLTDMETCYKVFRREVLRKISLVEDRFGFEPEVVAKIAQLRVRIFEMGISYKGRTYAEGKKIVARDGLRAIYCILKYNLPTAPFPIQFLMYASVAAFAALVNLLVFAGLNAAALPLHISVPSAFLVAAAVNYVLCVSIIFRHRARWNSAAEVLIFLLVVIGVGVFDYLVTRGLVLGGLRPVAAKLVATAGGLILNFLGRRHLVFPEPARPDWRKQLGP